MEWLGNRIHEESSSTSNTTCHLVSEELESMDLKSLKKRLEQQFVDSEVKNRRRGNTRVDITGERKCLKKSFMNLIDRQAIFSLLSIVLDWFEVLPLSDERGWSELMAGSLGVCLLESLLFYMKFFTIHIISWHSLLGPISRYFGAVMKGQQVLPDCSKGTSDVLS